MLAALASAALIPINRLAAGTTPFPAAHSNCDKKLAATITALERGTWEAFQKRDAKTWGSICADGFFEVTSDGYVSTKQEVLDLIRGRTWETPRFEMSNIEVFRLNETSAVIRYVIEADFLVTETDEDTGEKVISEYFTNATAICTYAKIRGRWQACVYQETTLPEFQE
jgi:hypothetical protein